MHKILHVGPYTCSVVSKLLKEEDTEAWGVEPYDIDDADANCKSLVRKGIVRVADIKFPLPYRAKSFSLVIMSDASDYLSPKYLNRTLPELVRVSAKGLVIFAGKPLKHFLFFIIILKFFCVSYNSIDTKSELKLVKCWGVEFMRGSQVHVPMGLKKKAKKGHPTRN